ncbi:MAG: hypothetical protein M2R45_00903 [Verrucomicrobia subdivision 3 bacterium]|nr:hypothetical protein [Limisphaerales bacterium]MCS1414571.1 hypothetical protein [Limisphaerales bacterium]
MPGVGLIHDHHAGILSKFPSHLPFANVDGIDLGSAVLKQTISETSGRSAEVDSSCSVNANSKMLDRLFEFVSTTTDVLVGLDQFDVVSILNHVTWFICPLPIDADNAGQHGTLCLLSTFAEFFFRQVLIEASLHGLFLRRRAYRRKASPSRFSCRDKLNGRECG